jgi:hypothetical protein
MTDWAAHDVCFASPEEGVRLAPGAAQFSKGLQFVTVARNPDDTSRPVAPLVLTDNSESLDAFVLRCVATRAAADSNFLNRSYLIDVAPSFAALKRLAPHTPPPVEDSPSLPGDATDDAPPLFFAADSVDFPLPPLRRAAPAEIDSPPPFDASSPSLEDSIGLHSATSFYLNLPLAVRYSLAPISTATPLILPPPSQSEGSNVEGDEELQDKLCRFWASLQFASPPLPGETAARRRLEIEALVQDDIWDDDRFDILVKLDVIDAEGKLPDGVLLSQVFGDVQRGGGGVEPQEVALSPLRPADMGEVEAEEGGGGDDVLPPALVAALRDLQEAPSGGGGGIKLNWLTCRVENNPPIEAALARHMRDVRDVASSRALLIGGGLSFVHTLYIVAFARATTGFGPSYARVFSLSLPCTLVFILTISAYRLSRHSLPSLRRYLPRRRFASLALYLFIGVVTEWNLITTTVPRPLAAMAQYQFVIAAITACAASGIVRLGFILTAFVGGGVYLSYAVASVVMSSSWEYFLQYFPANLAAFFMAMEL